MKEKENIMPSSQLHTGGPGVVFRDGLQSLAKGDLSQAMQQFRLIFRQAKRSGDDLAVAWSLYHIGLAFRDQRNYMDEIEVLDEARSLLTQMDNKLGQGLVLRELSFAYTEIERNSLALEYGSKSVQILEELENKEELAWAYERLSTVYLNLYQRGESLAYAKKARELFSELNIIPGLAWNAANLGHLHLDMGFYAKAEEFFIEAQDNFRKLDHLQGVAWSTLGQGMVQRSQSQFDFALKSFEKAYLEFEKLGLKDRMGWCLLNQAAVLRLVGREEDSIVVNKKALQIFGPQRNHDGVGWAYFQLAQLLRDRGQYPKAWQTVRQALILHTDIENKKGIGWSENEMGKIYLELGDQIRAKECFVRAKVAGESLDESRLRLDADKGLAQLQMEEGYLQKVAILLEQIEQTSRRVEARETVAKILLMKTRYHLILGEVSRAADCLNEVVQSIEDFGLKRLLAPVGVARGEILLCQNKIQEALTEWKEVVIQANKLHQKPQRTEALMGIAQVVARQQLWSQWDRLIVQLDRDVKAMNSKKLRAKLALIKAVANVYLDSNIDRQAILPILNGLSMSGLWVFKSQALSLLTHLTGRTKQYKDQLLYQKEREAILSKGVADLYFVSARLEFMDLLPISVVS